MLRLRMSRFLLSVALVILIQPLASGEERQLTNSSDNDLLLVSSGEQHLEERVSLVTIDQGLLYAFEESLRDDMLAPFYPGAIDNDVYGGFVEDRSATWEWQFGLYSDKWVVAQARYTWTAAKAALRYAADPAMANLYMDSAAAGFEFLQRMWGFDYGGGRIGMALVVDRDGSSPRVGNKGTYLVYGNAHALYAVAAYYTASGESDALDLAVQVYDFLNDYLYDTSNGGYYINLTDMRKDTNVNLHVLEALIEFYQALPEMHNLRPEVASRIGELINCFGEKAIHCEGESATDCFAYPVMDRNWTSNSNTVSFGHDAEMAFLMVEAMEALGQDPLASPYMVKIRRVVDFTFSHAGYRSDGALYYTGTYDNGNVTIIDSQLQWWPQAEGLSAVCLMRKLFPNDPFYEGTIALTWTFIDSHVIDHTNHGWVRQADGWSLDKASEWHANYHHGRALINCLDWLSNPCEGDGESDGDNDGVDLSRVVAHGGVDIDIFAEDFGRVDCPTF
jgi:mannobiose 2-epimerase